MPKYSRKTILKATDLLENASHDDIDRFLLEHDLEGRVGIEGSTRDRANSVARFLFDNLNNEEDGQNLADLVVEEVGGRGNSKLNAIWSF